MVTLCGYRGQRKVRGDAELASMELSECCAGVDKKKELGSISEFEEMFEPVGADSGSSVIISQAQPFKLGL